MMRHWRPIREDLETTSRHPRGDLAMHRQFVEKNDITEWAFVPWRADYIPFILREGRFPPGYRRFPVDGVDCGPPPGLDHGRLYRSRGRRVHLVYHPYCLTEAEKEQLGDWSLSADAVSIILPPEKSWYYPGHTLLVIVTATGIRF